MTHNKLVRDRIPEIIEKNGQTAVTRVLNEYEYRDELERKLDEEVAEFHEGGSLEELADILEVVYALAKTKGCSLERFLREYQRKHEQRGGFDDRIYLIRTE